MTEREPRLREDELDEEDILARAALMQMQATVDEFLARTGRSINEMSEEQQQALVDAINPQLAFELRVSDDLYVGIPLTIGGAGGFIIADEDESLLGAQKTTDGDVITGLVSAVKAYPVPSRSIILQQDEPGDEIPCYDQSISAVILLENAKFHSHPSRDGGFDVVHDLSEWRAVVPVVYRMKTRVADSLNVIG